MSEARKDKASLLDYVGPAKFYRGLGFSPIPVNRSDKVPRLGTGYLETYAKRRPIDEEFNEWFSNPDDNLGIGIITAGDITTIDIDGKMLWPLACPGKRPEEKAKATWVHETPRGYRIFVRVPGGIIKGKVSAPFPGEHRGIELKPSGAGYVIAPPTPGYLALNTPAQSIQNLTGEETKVLVSTVRLYAKFARLIDDVSKLWTEGKRHDLAGPLAGALRKSGLKIEETETIIDAICSLAGDLEKSDRGRYIDDTYSKPLEEIAGLSKLKDILVGIASEVEVKAILAPFHRTKKTKRGGGATGAVEGREEGPEPPKWSPEVEAQIDEEVNRIKGADNQLQALKPHLENVLVGEDDNKQALFVLHTGSKYQVPEFKQIIVLKSTEGAGKSAMMRALTTGYKVKDVGRFSAHALDYTDLRGYEILALKEIGSMDMEKQGVSTLKFLSSDDQGYTVEVTARDEETGRFKTEQYRIPCMTVISTTTRLSLDPQFERRSWTFNLDESEGQTRGVAGWKARLQMQNDEKLLGLRKITDYEYSREVIARFIRQLQPKKIIIPFPQALSEVWGFKVLRLRGDIDKVYAFVRLYASLNTKRLTEVGSGLYALTPEVALEALDLIDRPLASMFSRLDKRMKEIFDALKAATEVVDEEDPATGQKHEKKNMFDKRGAQIDNKLRSKIAVQLGRNEEAIRRRFRFLVEGGFYSDDEKKPKTYTLLYNVEEIEEKISGILLDLGLRNSLSQKMKEEGQNLLQRLLRLPTFVDGKASELQATGASTTPNPSIRGGTRNSYLDTKQGENANKGSNNCAISECATIRDNTTNGTLTTVTGTREKFDIILKPIDQLEAKSGLANLDELEDLAEKEYGIDRSDFGSLISKMIREGLIVATGDERGVRRAIPNPQLTGESVIEGPAGVTGSGAGSSGPMCGDCEKHTTPHCIMPRPDLIRAEATYARYCGAFVRRSQPGG